MNKIRVKNKNAGLCSLNCPTIIMGLLFLSFCLLSLSGCSKNEKVETVILTLSPVDAAPTSSSPLTFDEKTSQVLRCVSLSEKEGKITAEVSKSKSVEVKALIFVRVPDTTDSVSANAEIAWLVLDKSENQYDMSKAFYHTVGLSSVEAAVNMAGLPYDDWLVGTMSQDELFPCCQ